MVNYFIVTRTKPDSQILKHLAAALIISL